MYQPSEARYETMTYNRCGKSGLKLPAVSLGCWHNFGDDADPQRMKELIFTAFDAGITHIDLANNYGPAPGAAEKNIGRILREDLAGYRDELIISTKAGYEMWPGPYGNFGSRKYLLASLDQSLKRLGLDYVDIFYQHRPDPDTPLEESLGALETAVKSGKALYAGLSKYDGPLLREAVKFFAERHVPFVICQNRYSLLDRTIEQDGLRQAVLDEGLGLITFSPLAQGLLTDRYLNGIPSDSRMASGSRFLNEDALNPELLEKLRKLNGLAAERGQTLAEMALAWLLQDEAVTSVLIGASRPEQIKTNLKAMDAAPITAEERAKIEEILA